MSGEDCTKIYISDGDRSYYEKLGVTVHEGPRGGIYVCGEDIRRQWMNDFTRNMYGAPVFVDAAKRAGFKNVKVVDDSEHGGFFVVLDNKTKIYIYNSVLAIWSGNVKWKIKGDVENLVVGYKILLKALDNIDKQDYKFVEKSFGPFKDVIVKSEDRHVRLIQSIIFESLEVGSHFIDDISDVDDLDVVIEYIFGPWVGNNMFRVSCDNTPINVTKDRRFWPSLIQMVGVAGSLNNLPKFVFDSGHNMLRTLNMSVLGYYDGTWNEIHFDVAGDLHTLWHEFGHFLHYKAVDNVDPRFRSKIESAAEYFARSGFLGQYAKTNYREAFAETLRTVVLPDLAVKRDIIEYNIWRDMVEWVNLVKDAILQSATGHFKEYDIWGNEV